MWSKGKLVLLVLVIIVVFGAPSLCGQTTIQRSAEGLIYDLKNPDVPTRVNAAREIGRNKLRQAVPALIEASEDPDVSVRVEVTRALVAIDDPRALSAFVRLCHDPGDKRIQQDAIKGIVQIYTNPQGGFTADMKKAVDFLNPLSDGYNPLMVESYVPVSQEAVTALSDLLFTDDKGLRKNAAVALGILRAQGALPAIKEALGKETEDDVKVELIWAVYKIGDRSAGETLLPFVRDPDKRVHDEAILVLGRLGVKEAIPVLTELYTSGVEEKKKMWGLVPVTGSDDLQKKILESLAYIGDPQSNDIFEGALSDERSHFRRFGAEGLGRSKSESHLSLIAKKYLREDSSDVKLAMGFALFRLGREEHLVELVDNAQKDQAYYYLLEFEPEEVKALYPYVQTEKKAIRIRLIDVLGLRGDASAIPLVEEMSSSEDADIASSANVALRRLRARQQSA